MPPRRIPQAAAAPPQPKMPPPRPRAAAKVRTSAAAALPYRHANRPGFVLNDAQIAEHQGAAASDAGPGRHVAGSRSGAAQYRLRANGRTRTGTAPGRTASRFADPDSVEVQGLKSAAIPLIMSFSDEQKNEVRSLAHVMGLDNLASEF